MDGRLKSKKEIEGLNKVAKKNYEKKDGNESYTGDAGQKRGGDGAEDHREGENVSNVKKSILVDKIMTREMKERLAMALQVKAECKAQGEDVDRRGYTKHYAATS